jgi:hypothetical protein
MGEKVTFIKNELNVALGKNEFTVERLGVRPGVRVTDYAGQIVYRYGDPDTIQEFHFSPEQNRWTTE